MTIIKKSLYWCNIIIVDGTISVFISLIIRAIKWGIVVKFAHRYVSVLVISLPLNKYGTKNLSSGSKAISGWLPSFLASNMALRYAK